MFNWKIDMEVLKNGQEDGSVAFRIVERLETRQTPSWGSSIRTQLDMYHQAQIMERKEKIKKSFVVIFGTGFLVGALFLGWHFFLRRT
jgi:hypothetical protein